jgi:hypothetical protein
LLTLAVAFIIRSRTLQVLRSLLADADTAASTATAATATATAAPREGRTSSAAGSSASAAEGSLLAGGTVAEQQQRRAAVDARRHELQYLQGEGASLAALALAQVCCLMLSHASSYEHAALTPACLLQSVPLHFVSLGGRARICVPLRRSACNSEVSLTSAILR